MNFIPIFECDLEDGVRTRWVDIGAILGGDSNPCAEFDYLDDVLDAGDFALGESDNIDIIFGIFPGEEDIPFVE